jgi:hypothetical protein
LEGGRINKKRHKEVASGNHYIKPSSLLKSKK